MVAERNNGNKLRILIVHNYYQIPGGEDTVVANEKKLLEDHGHEVTLYTRSNDELKSMAKWRKLLLPFTTIYNPRTAKDIKRIIVEKKIDIVHVHNTLNLISPAVYYAARELKVPVVQTMHNFRLLCPGATFYRDGHICEECVHKNIWCSVKHACYRKSRLQTLLCAINTKIHRMTGIVGDINYIALTEFNKDKLLQIKQIKPEKVFLKPNFVEQDAEEKHRTGFIYAGRLDELKGIKTLVEAWKIMGKNAPHLIICGTGPLEEWCKNEIHGLNVEMKGFVNNEAVKQMIARSCSIILPTLWYEGFPMTILEAYSVGTPVICSDIGNAGSVVTEGVTGWKFTVGDAKGLVKVVRNWYDISDSVYTVFMEKYTPESNYEQLLHIYSAIK